MEFYSLDNWENGFRHDGLLFFTQRIQEMLFHYTNQLYRVPVFNTYLLAQEYLQTARLVHENIIQESNLQHIFAEFKDSFDNDIVIQKNIPEEIRKEFYRRIEASSLPAREKIMQYIFTEMRNYNDWCKRLLLELVPKEKEKKKINSVLRSYISGLIGAGYSSEFIYYFNKQIFHQTPVTSLESLSTFLNRFDYQKHEYVVFVPVNQMAKQFKDILKSRLNVEIASPSEYTKFAFDKKTNIVLKIQREALDERSAANDVNQILGLFFRYVQFVRDTSENWIYNKAMVITPKGETSFVALKTDGFNFVKKTDVGQSGELAERIVTSLISKAPTEVETLNRVVDLHNSALTDKNIENGFLNLWSTVEILFVSEQTDSKINEIVSKMIPILENDYFRMVSDTIRDYLQDTVPALKQDEIKEKTIFTNDENWIDCLLFLKDNTEARDILFSSLEDYPLVRYRVHQMAEIFAHRNLVKKELERYTQRITWHIRRLYRTRNAIIHSGKKPPYLKELGEHLHSYLDECIYEFFILLGHKNTSRTIENAIIKCQIKSSLLLKRFDSKDAVSESDMAFVLNILE